MKRWVAILLVACASEAAAGPPQAPFRQRNNAEQVWQSGETLTYNLTWLRVIGGSATFTIGPVAGEPRLRITCLAQSSAFFFLKVRDEIESIVDRDTFSTLRYRKTLNERGRTKSEETTIDQAKKIATRKEKEIAVPSPVYDPFSLIYHIRTLDLSPGRIHHFSVIADGKVYLVETTVDHRESITTDAGTFACVVVEPKLRGGGIFRDEDSRLLIWYSDDDRHVPVRIRSDVRFGTITASLRTISMASGGAGPQTARESSR